MTEYPILIFPEPDTVGRSKINSGPRSINKPSYNRQKLRLPIKFAVLQDTFSDRTNEIRVTSPESETEQVIVFEIVGNIENFENVANYVNNLEWMGKIDLDSIIPDEDFYDVEHPEKELSGKFYLIMTNQTALNELLAFWNRFSQDQDVKFDRGLNRLKDLFSLLKDVRRWNIQDRLIDNKTLEYWKQDLELIGDEVIRFETQLWYREDANTRTEKERYIRDLVESLEGNIISSCIIDEISYHALLVELPRREVQSIVDNPNTQFVKCDDIMFFRPIGQMLFSKEVNADDLELIRLEREIQAPNGNPIVALIDGLPLQNHILLRDRLIIDDPDDFSDTYPANSRNHATSMASLICHGDLSNIKDSISSPLYVRPILKPNVFDNEAVPNDILIVDLLHRTVKRMFDATGNETPVAPDVKIINFSICDPAQMFFTEMSPLAKLIDWLSNKYSVLFIISVGNQINEINIDISHQEFEELPQDEKEKLILRRVFADSINRKILSPSESINSISVGAIHEDESNGSCPAHLINPYDNLLPSPISSFGTGYRHSIKPDIVMPGGKQLYREQNINPNSFTISPVINYSSIPGQKVALPGRNAGDVNYTAYTRGTSNAAALLTRNAVFCYDTLLRVFDEQLLHPPSDKIIVPLIKAMLVHGCSWGEIGEHIQNYFDEDQDALQIQRRKTNWIGYGLPEFDKVHSCSEQRASLIGYGELQNDQGHIYQLPIPASLNAQRIKKRLIISLAWLSKIRPKTQRYRNSSLWYEFTGDDSRSKNKMGITGSEYQWQTVRRGTIQHEIFEGERAMPFTDTDNLSIKVNCKRDAGIIDEPVTYGLFVTLEVAEGLDIPIYEEIRTRIAPPIIIQQIQD